MKHVQASVRVPVMSCPECLRTFNVPQWLELRRADRQPEKQPPDAELVRRHCSYCDKRMALDERNIWKLDTWMDADEYEQLWPHSDLPALARVAELRRQARRFYIAAAIAGAVTVTTVAAAVWGLM